jgi:hypothetical protein
MAMTVSSFDDTPVPDDVTAPLSRYLREPSVPPARIQHLPHHRHGWDRYRNIPDPPVTPWPAVRYEDFFSREISNPVANLVDGVAPAER